MVDKYGARVVKIDSFSTSRGGEHIGTKFVVISDETVTNDNVFPGQDNIWASLE